MSDKCVSFVLVVGFFTRSLPPQPLGTERGSVAYSTRGTCSPSEDRESCSPELPPDEPSIGLYRRAAERLEDGKLQPTADAPLVCSRRALPPSRSSRKSLLKRPVDEMKGHSTTLPL